MSTINFVGLILRDEMRSINLCMDQRFARIQNDGSHRGGTLQPVISIRGGLECSKLCPFHR